MVIGKVERLEVPAGNGHDLQRSLFARLPTGVLLLVCVLMLALIGLADYFSGQELASDLFYLVPVALAAWYAGRNQGLLIGTLAAALWLLVKTYERAELHPAIHLWNGGVRLAFFVFAAALIARLRAALVREEALARYDALTGTLNRRFFYLLAQREIERARRQGHPLTIAYLDLDNFKQVNDRQGHAAGDDLLRRFADIVRAHIRATDLLARLGGDEFALFFPETDASGGQHALEKLRALIHDELRLAESPVTISVGALTLQGELPDIEQLVHRADDLMYRNKHGGKNAIQFESGSQSLTLTPTTSE
ncbi:MAG: GGDEF domain-containing protein [Gemmataceae bacterium]